MLHGWECSSKPKQSHLEQFAFRVSFSENSWASYYALAETFIFPTHTDPWGLVVNEAMACGLPVISTSVAGCVADLVEDRWNGRVVATGDSLQLASAMAELATDAELRSQMQQRGRERILRYSPEACAAGIATAINFLESSSRE